jgi:putative Mg2+ transporter-C (MgtC) family protein
MPLTIDWREIILRLGLSLVASCIIGLNREHHGEAAGLRTTMLVCLAAAVSMVQVNLLMVTNGKTNSSFVIFDLMRLPLGILTGVGFIGAGAIIKKNNIATGVTTAATLWYVTVMGLCFGGGQIGLGVASLVIGILVLGLLKSFERRNLVSERGKLYLTIGVPGLTQSDVEALICQWGAKPVACAIGAGPTRQARTMEIVVTWNARPESSETPGFVEKLLASDSIDSLKWIPDRAGSGLNPKSNVSGTPGG